MGAKTISADQKAHKLYLPAWEYGARAGGWRTRSAGSQTVRDSRYRPSIAIVALSPFGAGST